MSEFAIEIENLAAFRRAIRASQTEMPRAMSSAIRKAGRPIIERASEVAPRGPTGRLKKSYSVRTSGTTGRVISRVPYGTGAEWGLHGKWKGFKKYRPFGTGASTGRGRFAWRAVVERKDEVIKILDEELRDIIQLQGWARP